MNKSYSGLNTLGVYYYKNIEITDRIEFDNNRIFDHPILFGKAKFSTYLIKENSTLKVLDKVKVNYNNDILNNISLGEENIKKMISPFKIIELKSYEQQIDIQKFGEEYNKIKKEAKIKNIEEMRSRYNSLNIILTQNKLNDENWIKN